MILEREQGEIKKKKKKTWSQGKLPEEIPLEPRSKG
jgi:hypothetical protein